MNEREMKLICNKLKSLCSLLLTVESIKLENDI